MRSLLAATGIGLWLAIACIPVAAQQPGQSFQARRATPADLNNLNTSILQFIQAERAFNSPQRNDPNTGLRETLLVLLEAERQRQLMGGTENPDPERPSSDLGSAELMSRVRQWWVDHVLQPALDIAANPAATCALAQSMLRRIVTIERQHQILVGDSTFGNFGDSDAIMGRAFRIAKTRCLEEAFDECMNTGNGQALIQAITEWSPQAAVAAADDETAFGEQVVYLFRRCTVYQLSYHMDLTFAAVHPESYTADGSFTLLFQPGETGMPVFRMAQGLWRAPRARDRVDIRMSRPICGGRAARCHELPPVWHGQAWGIIMLQRDVTEQTIEVFRTAEEAKQSAPSGTTHVTVIDEYVTNPDHGWPKYRGGVVVLRTIRHREGHNRLTLNFGPPLVGYHVTADYGIHGRFEDEGDPMDNGTSLYYLATQSAPGEAPLLINDDTWVRGSYPVLYETAHTATAKRATETTRFSFTHRPDLFPADEIRQDLELARKPPEPHRIPAQPRF